MAFGLTANGFVLKRQQDIIDEIRLDLQSAFGQNINLLPESVFGQLVGLMSEREALIWELAQAVYDSQYPNGAQGTSVDNILALNNLRRLQASASVTSPTNADGINGLELYGTPATVIPAGSLISVFGSPSQQFSLDAAVTIQPAVDDVQTVYFSSVPDSGSFKLNIVPPTGPSLQTSAIPYTANAAAVQAAITALSGYSGVTVSGDFTTGLVITFGGTSGQRYQNLFTVSNNSLQLGIAVTNVAVSHTVKGTVAKGVGSATCTVTGPITAPAGTLTVIVTPVGGWATVNNPLDVVVGRNAETDTEALTRRRELLAAGANGTLASIASKVRLVTGVTSATPFQNLSEAAIQMISFDSVPISGNFTIQIGPLTTGLIPYTATSATLQAAINALSGYEPVLVSGDFDAGFTIDFNGSNGGQPQPLILIPSNTLSVAVSVDFQRPGKSFEIIVEGGQQNTIAAAIQSAKPAGIESYGRPVKALGDLTLGSNQILNVANAADILEGQLITGYGIPINSVVTGVSGTTVTMSLAAIVTTIQSYMQFGWGQDIPDEFDIVTPIRFSRPILVPFYVQINLSTDLLTAVVPKFNVSSISTIQQDIVDIGNSVPVGGLVKGFGSDGLIGAFNDVPGITYYTLLFGRAPAPFTNTNVQLGGEERAQFELFNVLVAYT